MASKGILAARQAEAAKQQAEATEDMAKRVERIEAILALAFPKVVAKIDKAALEAAAEEPEAVVKDEVVAAEEPDAVVESEVTEEPADKASKDKQSKK